MLKLLGGCMILGGCFGLGLWYRAQFQGRLREVRLLRRILELLSGEVRYGRATLPECCGHVAKYLSPPMEEAFLAIEKEMGENTGLSFGEIFRSRTEAALQTFALKEEDREIFFRFAEQTGFADGQMQLKTLEQSIELLRAAEEKLENENAGKCRMAVGLGAMSGMLLILILL